MHFFWLVCLLGAWLNPWAWGPAFPLLSWLLALAGLGFALLSAARAGGRPLALAGGLPTALPLALALAALLSALVGLWQYFGDASALAPWVSDSPQREAYANLRQRNQFASLMGIGLLALLCLRIQFARSAAAISPSSKPYLQEALWLGAAALLALGNALSSSRTGALQWLALLVLAWCWRRHLPAPAKRLLYTAVALYAVFVLILPWLAGALGNSNTGLLGRTQDANAFSRLALYGNVLELIAQKPWAGWGWRGLAYAHYSNDFSGARFMEMLDNAHNLPLHLAVELGLPVALGFCAVVLWLLWKNKPWAEVQPARQMAWGMLMVIGIHSLVEYPLWYGPFFMTALLCVGILCTDFIQKWPVERLQIALAASKIIAIALLAGTAYMAFDYHRVSQIYLQPEERSTRYAADPLGAAKQSVLFHGHARFAELMITPLTRENAAQVLQLSSELVQWSPEPRVIEKLIESATMLGLDDLALFHLRCFKRAYPQAHAAWAERQGLAASAPR